MTVYIRHICYNKLVKSKLTETQFIELHKKYLAGESSVTIGQSVGLHSLSIRRNFRKFGLSVKTHTEARLDDARKVGKEVRSIRAKGSHDAIRGKRKDHNYHIKRSLGVQNNPKWSKYEIEAAKYLPRGFIHEIAIDGYNFDFGYSNQKIAIEIDGGDWHNSERKRKVDIRKNELLKNLGWQLIRIKTKNISKIEDQIKNIRLSILLSL